MVLVQLVYASLYHIFYSSLILILNYKFMVAKNLYVVFS